MADIEMTAAAPLFQSTETPEKDSVLAEYCKAAVSEGRERCIWICFNSNGRTLAKDINIEIGNASGGALRFRLGSLAYKYGWWKRFAPYSAVGVKEVQINFLNGNKQKGLDVLVQPVDYGQVVEDINQSIEKYRQEINDGEACVMDKHGHIHPPNERCLSESWNEWEGTYCPVLKIIDLKVRRQKVQSSESMLRFYWGTKLSTDCSNFLWDNGFVHSYRALQRVAFMDCLHPYGRAVKALLIVEGWHLGYLVSLVGCSIVVSIVATAIVTLVKEDIQMGLAAGSYCLAAAAVLLGLLTILTSVL